MKTHNNTSDIFLSKDLSQDSYFEAQSKIVFEALKLKPSTTLMVSIETGILRASICRYVAKLEKQGKIHLLHKGMCPISKHKAGFYTSSNELFPVDEK